MALAWWHRRGVGGRVQNINCISSTRQIYSLRYKMRMSSGDGNEFDALAHNSADWLFSLLTKSIRVQFVLDNVRYYVVIRLITCVLTI